MEPPHSTPLQKAPREPEQSRAQPDRASLGGHQQRPPPVATTLHLSADAAGAVASRHASPATLVVEGSTVAVASSYHALTSLSEHVDKVTPEAAAAAAAVAGPHATLLGQQPQALATLASGTWWCLLDQHQRRHTQLRAMLGNPQSIEQGAAQPPEVEPRRQMLLAVQHMSELRNELRAMDNHLFQLISYCLSKGATSQAPAESTAPPAAPALPQQQPAHLYDLSQPHRPTAEPDPRSPSPSPPPPVKRTVNLKKLRLLASTHLYGEPGEQAAFREAASLSAKKRRLSDSKETPPSPPAAPIDHSQPPPAAAASTYSGEPPLPAAAPSYPAYAQPAPAALACAPLPAGLQQPPALQQVAALGPSTLYYCAPTVVEREPPRAAGATCCAPPSSPPHLTATQHHNLLLMSAAPPPPPPPPPPTLNHLGNHQHHQHHQLSLLSEPAGQALHQRQQRMPFRCHVCGSGFEDKHRLQQHLSIHLSLHPSWFEEKTIKETMVQYESKRGDYLCHLCRVRHETTAEFDKHMQLHGDKPHRCHLCDQDNKIVSFRYYRQLLTHLRSHCFLYSCRFVAECKQTANRKDYLKLHILKHHLNNKLPDQHIVCCHWKIRKGAAALSNRLGAAGLQ